MSRGNTLSQQQPSYYGGDLTVGQTEAEKNAWDARFGYNSGVFNQNNLNFGTATNQLNNSLTGNNQLGQMSQAYAPGAQNALDSAFSPYNIGQRYDALQGPSGSITSPMAQQGQFGGNYGFGTSLNAQGMAPQYGQAGGLDATGAYNRMLSGQPDYAGTQEVIDAANADTMRQFNNTVVPKLNQNATFTNNMTGGIKGMNRALPELADRMNENSVNIRNQERLRALSSQEQAAQQVSQGGLQSYGLGLQTAQGQRGLEAQQAGMNLSADQARAQTGMQDQQMRLNAEMARYGMSQDASSFGLQREQAREAALGGARGDALGYGALAGNLASQSAADQSRSMAMFPSIYDTGRQGANDQLAYAQWDRALREDSLAADQDRFNYMRDQPMNQLGWYSSILNGTASPYGSQTTTGTVPQGSRAAGALGGAMAGYQLGNSFGYGGWGALLGGLAGAYM